MPKQEFIPDLFSEDHYDEVSAQLKRVDGLSLSNFLGARVFDNLMRNMLAPELELRSQNLLEDVKTYMLAVLKALCEHTCSSHNPLLENLTSALAEDFLDSRKDEAETAVSNLCQAELAWIWTQNGHYTDTLHSVQATVKRTQENRLKQSLTGIVQGQEACAIGGVPDDFIEKLISAESGSEKHSILELQVC